ncbi:hypothetical protein HPB47_006111 [Ixodes persulcatus]|uniref:Uncharacterized protein n=1 Tax=Ixodes persulcatus TaxID=34615 RepID=A0AC60PBI3_IXOPE|nr:hypothetical protein HPB47_006111 [Ixodes persulcatus]
MASRTRSRTLEWASGKATAPARVPRIRPGGRPRPTPHFSHQRGHGKQKRRTPLGYRRWTDGRATSALYTVPPYDEPQQVLRGVTPAYRLLRTYTTRLSAPRGPPEGHVTFRRHWIGSDGSWRPPAVHRKVEQNLVAVCARERARLGKRERQLLTPSASSMDGEVARA